MINDKILQMIKKEYQNSYCVKALRYPVDSIGANEDHGHVEIYVNNRELIFESEFGCIYHNYDNIKQKIGGKIADIDSLRDALGDAVYATYTHLLPKALPELQATIVNILPTLTTDEIYADQYLLTIEVEQFILDINMIDCSIHRISLLTHDINLELAQKKSEPIIKVVKQCFAKYCEKNL